MDSEIDPDKVKLDKMRAHLTHKAAADIQHQLQQLHDSNVGETIERYTKGELPSPEVAIELLCHFHTPGIYPIQHVILQHLKESLPEDYDTIIADPKFGYKGSLNNEQRTDP